jgi:hypothetical protein
MTFFDDLFCGMEQYRPDYPFGTPMPLVIPVIPTPKGLVEKKKWIFEYSFLYTTTEKSVYIGKQVLEEGSYVWHNALKFFMDKELKFPIEMSLNAMLENLTYEVDGENIQLKEIVENLEVGKRFSWVLYGSFIHPLNDVLTELEILTPDFLTCKLKMSHPLKSGGKFKVLFTLTKTEALKPPYVAFGIKGRGKRTGTS